MANVIEKLMDVLKLGYEDEGDFDQDEMDEPEEEKPARSFFRNKKEKEEAADPMPAEPVAKPDRKAKAATKKAEKMQTRLSSNVSVIKGGQSTNMNSEIVSIKPYDDSSKQEIGHQLLKGKNVLINLEGLDIDIAQRIVDFTAGVCFAINGDMKYPSKYFVLAVPNQVELSGFFEGEDQPVNNPMNVTFEKFGQF